MEFINNLLNLEQKGDRVVTSRMSIRGRLSKKLKPNKKIAPSMSVQEIHMQSSSDMCQLVRFCVSELILTFNK